MAEPVPREHGPGAAPRNVRKRFAEGTTHTLAQAVVEAVQMRDLALYDQLLETA